MPKYEDIYDAEIKKRNRLIGAGVGGVILFVLLVAFWPFTSIQAGSVGVMTRFGAVQGTVLEPGLHIVAPFTHVQEIDVRVSKDEVEASAASKDLQSVTATVVVNRHLDRSIVLQTYKDVGLGDGMFTSKVVTPAIQDAVKASTAQFTAEELITKRSDVSTMIEALLRERLAPYALVDSVSITNFDFSDSFNAAIEAKATAEQDALAQKNKLEQVKYEAEQRVVQAQAEADATKVKAEAEAEAIRITAAALAANKDLVELEAVKKWNGELPSYMMGDTVPFLNLSR